jgi:hypothetical protein
MHPPETLHPFHPMMPALRDVNAQALELMCDVLERERVPRNFESLKDLREALLGLDDVQRRRLAAIPHLLVDLNFRDVGWWRAIRNDSLRAIALVDRNARAARPRLTARPVARNPDAGVARGTDRSIARDADARPVGVADDRTDPVEPDEVQRAAERQALRLQPRWATHPTNWLHWIDAPVQHGARRDPPMPMSMDCRRWASNCIARPADRTCSTERIGPPFMWSFSTMYHVSQTGLGAVKLCFGWNLSPMAVFGSCLLRGLFRPHIMSA